MTIDVGDWLSASSVEQDEPCGIFIPPVVDGAVPRIPVPLRRRDVIATVYTDASFSDTKETLSYISDVDCTAIFRFPLPPRAAVHRFRAVFGDREVTTRVKPRAQAREEYELAVAQGHTAAHLAQHEAGAAVFEVSLGNLEAHTEVTVELAYLRLLERLGDTLEWSHTATWVPPYVGSAGDVATGVEKVAAALPTFASKVSYSLSYRVEVLAEAGAVRSIESPQPVTVTPPEAAAVAAAETAGAAAASAAGGDKQLSRWVVGLSEAVADPSKDLTLTIEMEPSASRRSSVLVRRTPADGDAESGEGAAARTVVLATFVPPVPPKQQGGSGKASALRRELWFVVDCSGSMGGTPIQQAREAALFFVRDLPVESEVRFNVTCFGSAHKSLWPACRPYGPEAEREAVAWIRRHVEADMGGTEILEALRHIYSCPITPGFTREVIFLTDGGISGHEEQAIYDLIAPPKPGASSSSPSPSTATSTSANPPPPAGIRRWLCPGAPSPSTTATITTAAAKHTHVLSLGIGHGVHRGLLDGMASRTDGAAVYVVDEEAIASKAAFLKRAATAAGAALRPRLTARGALVRAAPHVLPQRLFVGEPLHVLLEVVECEPDATLELTAEYGSEYGTTVAAGDGETAETAVAAGGKEAAAAPPPPPLRLSLPLGAAAGPGAAAAEGEALGVLHAMAYIGGLLSGSSPLHVRPDGSPLQPPPSPETIKDAVVRLAVARRLVTPYTSAVGVALRRDPADPEAARNVVEVPLQLPHGRKLWNTFHEDPRDLRGGGGFGGPARALCFAAAPPPAVLFAAAPCSAAPPPHVLFGAAPGGAPMGMPMMAPMAAPVPQLAAAPAAFKKMSAPMRRGVATAAAGAGDSGGAAELACLEPLCDYFEDKKASGFGAFVNSVSSALGGRGRARKSSATAAASMAPPAPAPAAAPAMREAAFGPASASAPTASESADEGEEREEYEAEEQQEAQPASGSVSQPPAARGPLAGSALLEYLNLARDTRGFWRASGELATALGMPTELLLPQTAFVATASAAPADAGGDGVRPEAQPPATGKAAVAAVQSSAAAATSLRPVGLSDDAWATVVVLARLRGALAEQRGVWGDMEAKAMAWLAGCWPAGARSVGSTVLALAKALPPLSAA